MLSVAWRYPFLRKVPETALLPRKVDLNLRPSSSLNAMTSTGLRSPREASESNRSFKFLTAVMADTMPRVPSYAPPSTTVSMCEPRRRTLASSRYSPSCSSLPCRLPTLSSQVLRPASSIHLRTLASALRDPGLRNVRSR